MVLGVTVGLTSSFSVSSVAVRDRILDKRRQGSHSLRMHSCLFKNKRKLGNRRFDWVCE